MLICGEIQEELRACKLKRKHQKKLFNIVKLKKILSIICYIKSVYKYTF